MKTALGALLFSAASAAELKLTWSDCGDSSTHLKITGFTPATASTDATTHMVGTGTVDEDVTGATFDLELKTAVSTVSCKGDAGVSKTCDLPLGTGSVTFNALTFPINKGTTTVAVDLKLGSLPSILLNTATKVAATAANGHKFFCVEIKTAPATEANEVHPDRVAMLEEIKNAPGVLWKAKAHPRWASQAPGAAKSLCGVIGDTQAHINDLIKTGEIEELLTAANMDIPDSFDSATNWPHCAQIIDDIRDQSGCGCCWAFGGAEAASDRMCIATNATIMVPLSAQDICFNAGGFVSRGCSGGQISSPWSYMNKKVFFGGKGAVSGGQYQGSGPFGKGFCSDFSLPHCHHHGPKGKDPYPAENTPGCPLAKSPAGPKACDSDAVAPHNDFAKDKYSYTGSTITAKGETGIQQAIMAGGPVEVAFNVYADFENYASGIYHHVSGAMMGGHAVKITGWGVESGSKYWKVANSWNPYWGEKGYFRILRGNNEGTIENQVIGSSPTAKWSRAGDAKEVVV